MYVVVAVVAVRGCVLFAVACRCIVLAGGCCSLFVVCCRLLSAACCLLCVVIVVDCCCLSVAVSCWYYVLFVVCCLSLFVACCELCVGCLVLFRGLLSVVVYSVKCAVCCVLLFARPSLL